MKDLKGKVAVVTGAASGIGLGMAETFVAAGMRVVLSDVERPALESAADSLRAKGAEVYAVLADVSNAEAVSSLAQSALGKYGAVHVLCNNAGVAAGGTPSWMSTLDDWKWILGVNLMGVVHGMRTFLPIMIEQGEDAHIVNTASLAGLFPGGLTLYSATKSAVVALSESVYLELVRGGFRPRMSVLCPGLVDTNILNCARNRPAGLANAGPVPSGPGAEAFKQWFANQLKQGLSPRAVGEQVLQAIRDERFYILTHPDWVKYVEHRMKQIVSGENPTVLPLPGMETLAEMLAASAAAG
jgi:NAD(P)-dependent dehydrogenase (short-subunit alcohol dehydrogenase family)